MRCLTLNNLLCMDTAADEDQSQAAANGKSKDRIMLAFKKPCCKQRCKRHLTFKMIYTCCITFWSLSKSGQDALLLDQMWVHHFYKGMPLSFLIPPSKTQYIPLCLSSPRLWSLQADGRQAADDQDCEDSSGSSSGSNSSRAKWFIEGLLLKAGLVYKDFFP